MRNGRLAVIAQALDSAGTPGRLQLYAAPRPAAGARIDDNPWLVELRLAHPAAAQLNAGRLVLAPIGPALCQRSGVAAWARLADGDGRWVADLDVGLPGSDAEVQLSAPKLLAGGLMSVTLADFVE